MNKRLFLFSVLSVLLLTQSEGSCLSHPPVPSKTSIRIVNKTHFSLIYSLKLNYTINDKEYIKTFGQGKELAKDGGKIKYAIPPDTNIHNIKIVSLRVNDISYKPFIRFVCHDFPPVENGQSVTIDLHRSHHKDRSFFCHTNIL
jgi:hypothetical protein